MVRHFLTGKRSHISITRGAPTTASSNTGAAIVLGDQEAAFSFELRFVLRSSSTMSRRSWPATHYF